MSLSPMTRRQLLKSALPAALGLAGLGRLASAEGDKLPPVRAITKGPKFHWFGYYDKLEFDPTGRYVLGLEVDFEHRSPRPDDVVKVGMVDLHDGDRWVELGQSSAWCWQQGCMLQWLPGSKTKILWNDREDDRHVCRVLDVKTKEQRTVPEPVYAVGPDGKTGVAADFRRLQDVRPGYGYAGVPDPSVELAPKDSGVWKVDLETGKQELILSVAEVARFGTQTEDMKAAKHWFNHLLYSPDGSRFVFLHRWRPESDRKGGFRTRMITAGLDGKGLYVLDPSGATSHFIWRDPKHILAWTNPDGKRPGFYLFKDATQEREQVGKDVMTENGHCTYLPGNEWVLNDTYPDKERQQHVYLYHVKTGRRVPLGDFKSPKEYAGEWRCDTHPRFSPDGKAVVIDSPHDGGRQLYLIDLNDVVS
jgi:Tol biopolymer transport system component